MKILTIALALLAAVSAQAQITPEQDAYCTAQVEQAQATAIQLRSPSSITGFTQSQATAGAPQAYSGIQESIGGVRKASATVRLAYSNCGQYTYTEDATLAIASAFPAIQRDALKHRLELIAVAQGQIIAMIRDAQARVDAQDLTLPTLYALQTTKAKLSADYMATLLAIDAIYIPDVPKIPVREMVRAAHDGDKNVEAAINRVQRASDWDVLLDFGARQQIPTGPRGPYGEATFTYNLGNRFEHRHLDQAATASAEFKASQEGGVVKSANVLEKQIHDTLGTEARVRQSLAAQDALIGDDLKAVENADTTNALVFKNQLLADRIALRVDIEDADFRLAALNQYGIDNF